MSNTTDSQIPTFSKGDLVDLVGGKNAMPKTGRITGFYTFDGEEELDGPCLSSDRVRALVKLDTGSYVSRAVMFLEHHQPTL